MVLFRNPIQRIRGSASHRSRVLHVPGLSYPANLDSNEYDGVPWNNNNAEHAVKPFAALRHIIGGVTTEKGLREYLVLLSICETCKYIGVDFLDFLRSGEKDIHAFADSRARTKTTLRSGKIALPTQ